ncbi:MAG: hypothetical protein CMK78_15030 [Pseudomonadales bacterium]|jgi:hypothetical protein|nr:hypothetical protein [Pseudomonadales bacterium]
MQVQLLGKVGDHADAFQSWVLPGNLGQRALQKLACDINANQPGRPYCVEPIPRFTAIAAAQVYPLHTGRQMFGNSVAMLRKYRGFSAGRVVLVEFANGGEEFTATIVVKVFGVDARLRLQQSAQ